jgi:putative hydrolase of the HAD superfamily
MRYEAVLLDLYDTLVWSEWFRLRDLISSRAGLDEQMLLKAFDASRPARGVGTYSDPEGDMAAVLDAAGVEPDPALVRELVELERDELSHRVHLYEDSLPAVRALRARGVKTALVSNCSHSTRFVVDRLELEDAMDAVILSFEVRAMKPDPAIYRAALEALGGVEPERALFVDDQPDYCDGAAAVGLDTRLILRPNDDPFDAPAAEDLAIHAHGHEIVTGLDWLG